MSTLTLTRREAKPAPLIAGCCVQVCGSIDAALRELKRVCQRNGRRPGARAIPGQHYPETRGQEARRKLGEAIRRYKRRPHFDP